MRPFVYIAAVRRSGSTVLSEALTQLPRAFVLREPRLGTPRPGLKARDVAMLRAAGIDVAPAVAAMCARPREAVRALRDELVPRLPETFTQLGVKEIRHGGFGAWREVFPDLRVVLLGRDPRDVYLSLAQRLREGTGHWSGAFTPEAVAADLGREFARQRRMEQEAPCLRVRYEDVCTDRATLPRVRAFVDSPLDDTGDVGAFIGHHPGRQTEHALHGGRITDRRVARFAQEPDTGARAAAEQVYALMADYRAFFGY
jgi:hypothetical protein